MSLTLKIFLFFFIFIFFLTIEELNFYLIISGERSRVSIVRTEDQMLHDSLNTGIYIPRHVTGAQIPRDKSIGY